MIKGVEADHTTGEIPLLFSFFRTEALSVRSFTNPTSKLTKEVWGRQSQRLNVNPMTRSSSINPQHILIRYLFIYCIFIVNMFLTSGRLFSGMLLGYGNTQCFSWYLLTLFDRVVNWIWSILILNLFVSQFQVCKLLILTILPKNRGLWTVNFEGFSFF